MEKIEYVYINIKCKDKSGSLVIVGESQRSAIFEMLDIDVPDIVRFLNRVDKITFQ